MAELSSWGVATSEKEEVPVAIISLSDAAKRREGLIAGGFPLSWVEGYWPATDMRRVGRQELESAESYSKLKDLYGREILPGEIGCLLSHKKVIQWFAEQSRAELMVVFEDDVVAETPDFEEELSKVISCLLRLDFKGMPIVCHLGVRPFQKRQHFSRKIRTEKLGNHCKRLYQHIDKKYSLWFAHAYIINKKAAIIYSDYSDKEYFLADDWRTVKKKTNIRITYTETPLFTQSQIHGSSIDPNHIRVANSDSIVRRAKISIKDGKILSDFIRYARNRIRELLVFFVRNLPGGRGLV